MPTFIDMSALTKRANLTGNEEFQVSATEKVTAQQVANIVQLSQVLMSGFSALSFTGIEKVKDNNSLLGSIAILYDLVAKGNIKLVSNGSTEYGFVSMGNVNGTNHGFGWLLSISEKAVYIKNDFTSPNPSTLNNIQWVNTIKTGEKVSLDGGIPIIEVGDFTMINEVWPAKQVPGSMCAFYTGSEVYSQPEATEAKYVGFIILDSDFSTNKQATVVAFAKTSGKQYIGRLEFEGQEINWFTNVNTPVTITDFKSLPNSVKNAKDGEIIPIIAPASASNGPTALVSTGPAYGYVQVAKTGSTKAYNFLVQMDSAGNGPRMYTGFVNTAANLIYWLPLNEEMNPNVLHGENIEEGLEYLVPDNVGDTVAFRITGDSSQVPNTTEGFGLLSKINGSESLVIATQINPANTNEEILYTGKVQNDGTGTTWNKVGMGPEKLSTWTNTDLSSVPYVITGGGITELTLNRKTKTTDILRIDFVREDENGHYQLLNVTLHVAAMDVVYQDGNEIVLDERYVNFANGEFYKLSFDASSPISNTSVWKLYINKSGTVPDNTYYIVGIYNISGK